MTRKSNELRPLKIRRKFTRSAPGSVMIQCGQTMVLCTASVDSSVPEWMARCDPPRGWITAEYSMLPGSTSPRKRRDRVRGALGPVQITVDCDVIQADGGTRTASITGAFVALVDAIHSIRNRLPDPDRYPLGDALAAVSVGVIDDRIRLDLDYELDAAAQVDMNVVMTGKGQFIEIQGTGEESTFSEEQLSGMLKNARTGIRHLIQAQQQALGKRWPFRNTR